MSLACLLLACGDQASSHRSQGGARAATEAADDGMEMSSAPANAAMQQDSGARPVPSGPPFTFQSCPGISELPVPPDPPSCDGDFPCGSEAHCYPVSGFAQASNAPDCSAGKCLPDKVFAAQGRITLQPCNGSAGPGVCAPHCFALVRNVFSVLFPRGEAGCGAEEVCVPCLNPLDFSSTGACEDRCGASP
jgi:hypothetical protein